MGAVVDEPIPGGDHIIDYASTMRSELLDIYLMSHCAFSLSDTTGLCDLSFMFRRPVAVANLFNLLLLHSWGGVLMPKKYAVERERRLFTLPELLANGGGPASHASWPDYAQAHGLRLKTTAPRRSAIWRSRPRCACAAPGLTLLKTFGGRRPWRPSTAAGRFNSAGPSRPSCRPHS